MTQRIDDSAAAAVTTDADPSEGLGVATPGAHVGAEDGQAGDLPTQRDERVEGAGTTADVPEGATEGQRTLLEMHASQVSDTDLSGLDPDDVPEVGPDADHHWPEES